MSLKIFLDVIRNLNNGSIIQGITDEESFYSLGSEVTQLYLGHGGKYYYLSQYINNDNVDNMADIELATIYNKQAYNVISPPEPKNSYLILFYEVKEINEKVYKTVIDLEENEYIFKKYVFYYTLDEYKAFSDWYNAKRAQGAVSANDLINDSETVDNINKNYIQFLLRLLIKIPFFKIQFKTIELGDFDSLLNKMISDMRKRRNEIAALNCDIFNLIRDNDGNIQKVSDILYAQKVGV